MRVRWTPQAEEDRIAVWEYIADGTVWILTLVHTARQWPPLG